MDKLAVFCKHAVETLTYFSMQLAKSFEAWGYEIFWMDMTMPGLSAWKLRDKLKRQNAQAVLLTFNFIGLSGEEELWDLDDEGAPAVSIWEKLNMRCLNIMVDHPVYYYEALRYPMPELRTFCIDRDHVSYMHRFYPDIFCEFLPLAGNEPDVEKTQTEMPGKQPEQYEQWSARCYPVVFTANYVPVSNIDRQLAQIDPEYRDFYYEILNALIQNPNQNLLCCAETYLRREMPNLNDSELCEAMRTMPAVDLWIRTYFREKTVRILAEGGVKIYLFGKDWEQIACSRPQNLVTSGRMVNSYECVQAMAQAKIALNTMPWFKDGAHDRIFTAMLQGAAALTDDSVYLREQFRQMESICYYELQNLERLPQMVFDLLHHPHDLYETACRGKIIAEQSHTWKNRAEMLKCYISGGN